MAHGLVMGCMHGGWLPWAQGLGEGRLAGSALAEVDPSPGVGVVPAEPFSAADFRRIPSLTDAARVAAALLSLGCCDERAAKKAVHYSAGLAPLVVACATGGLRWWRLRRSWRLLLL